MNTARPVSPGKSRRCPHCRSDILESAAVCPVCRHHLRFDQTAEPAGARFSALHVEGTLSHPVDKGAWEYSVVIAVRNQKGEEIARQVVGIGALSGDDQRTFDFSVEVFAPEIVSATAPPKVGASPSPPTATVSAPGTIQAKQGSVLSPARTVSQPPPRRTSTVSEARIISSPKPAASPDKAGTDPSGNPPKNPAGR